VRFDPVLNLRMFPSLEEGKRHDLVQMVQIDPDYTAKKAWRGRATVEFPSPGSESPWRVLPVRNIISAAYCQVDTELPLARFVMPY
jgi:acetoacetate decarboxylase